MTLAERIYQMLLWLYPAKHRRAYAEPMLQHARDLSRSARQRGSWHILVLCLSLLKDGIVNAGIEHLEASMMVNNRSKPFLIWIFANILGCGALAASLFVSPYLMSLSGIVLTAFIVSFPISLAQWIALRRFFPTTILWIITIPVGLIIILQMYQVIPMGTWQQVDDESTAVLTLLFLGIGFAIGLPQWLILRRQFSGSSIWLLGSSVGLGLGFGFVLATDLINQSGFVSAIAVLFSYTVVTGIVLARLLAYHNKRQGNLANIT